MGFRKISLSAGAFAWGILNLLSLMPARADSCPEGFVPKVLQHSVASSLIQNANDIPRGTSVCVALGSAEGGGLDDKARNGTGHSFQRAFVDGKYLPVPVEAFQGDLKNEAHSLAEADRHASPPDEAEFIPASIVHSGQKHSGEVLGSENACVLTQSPSLRQAGQNTSGENKTPNRQENSDSTEDRLMQPESGKLSDSDGKITRAATSTEEAARELTKQDLFNSILDAHKSLEEAAASDEKTISAPYRKLSFESLNEYLKRAEKNLAESAQDLSSATAGMESSEIMRFKNVYLNAHDQAALGLGAIEREETRRKTLGEVSPFAGLLAPETGNPLARNQELSELFGNPAPLSQDALVERLVMFSGMDSQDQTKILSRLKLAEITTLTLKNGQKRRIPILHNGYILGASSTGLDCSSLVTAALPPEIRKARFTTLDFRAMWIYLRTGKMPTPPHYKKDRAALIRETSQAFVALNVYAGERLGTGDLLVYRLPWDTSGHVFVVRTYDPRSLIADVIEAAQSAGTIRERTFALSTDPPGEAVRLLRPGLFTLRLKPVSNRACQYKKDGLKKMEEKKMGGEKIR